jgi:hypothetical protein
MESARMSDTTPKKHTRKTKLLLIALAYISFAFVSLI